MPAENELSHHGITGMKWGVRRYQNVDGTRTPAGKRREERRDAKWASKGKGAKITEKAKKATTREAETYARATTDLIRTSSGRLSKSFINNYNKKLAELMNERVGNVQAPSGKVLRYVAKRGEIGVHTALADQSYNMEQVKNGIHSSGRVAYRKTTINKVSHSALMHHGVKGQKWGVRRTPEELESSRESGTMKLGDVHIGKKAKEYSVYDPDSGESFSFVEGSKIMKVEAFAGKGAGKSLNENVKEGLTEQFGGTPSNWQHCKGQATLDYHGEDRTSEVHWFQEDTAGRHVFKNKKWKD